MALQLKLKDQLSAAIIASSSGAGTSFQKRVLKRSIQGGEKEYVI
jgi:hypothetical protein